MSLPFPCSHNAEVIDHVDGQECVDCHEYAPGYPFRSVISFSCGLADVVGVTPTHTCRHCEAAAVAAAERRRGVAKSKPWRAADEREAR